MLLAAAATALASAAQAEAPIRIAASLPLTGSFSVSGAKHEQGYRLCVDLINEKGGLLGRKLELILGDNRSDTETAINQYERFINADKADLVFGTFSSKLTFPVSAVMEKYGMVHPVPAGGALRIWSQGLKHAFYFQQNAAELVGESLVEMIDALVPPDERPKTAAVVHSDDFFANGIAAGLLGRKVENPGGGVVADLAPGYLADHDVKVVMEERWPEEGFSDWLNLANSVKRSEAELVIGLTASAEEAVQLTRALQTVKAQPKFLYLSQGTQAEYAEGAGKAAEGVAVHTSWHPAVPFVGLLAGATFTNQDFRKAFEAKYGTAPDEDSAIPFAVCQGMEQAVRATGSTDNRKLSEWLHARTKEDPVRTVLGPFNWDERGLPKGRPFLEAQWQGGVLKFVYPTDEFEGVAPLVYPKPQW
ncbi:branched-chain amino acid ABC transporter substrate-binding protein [Rhizobiales bacterium L72]|uniref:Branched-chain amino acid ABC transporter substrate-binding protein n=2 Tax=Propylenella binzhouense TaxID=2555902 RepID=A0A964T779_9HYPH|nr:branched-chain amino acid ABC transporter substrate-binding protein [Propylenella binzhouense]